MVGRSDHVDNKVQFDRKWRHENPKLSYHWHSFIIWYLHTKIQLSRTINKATSGLTGSDVIKLEVEIWVTLHLHKDPILLIWSPYDNYKPRYNVWKYWPIRLQHHKKVQYMCCVAPYQHCNDIRNPYYEFEINTTINSKDTMSQNINQSNRRIY